MLPYNARKLNQGFTLIEMLAVVIILGVVAAMAAPNFLGLMRRTSANSALSEIEGAIKEAQRMAIRNGNSCTLTITAASRTVDAPCLLRTRVFQDYITIDANQNITFSAKGNTANNATIVVGVENNASIQRCLVLAAGLGMMRTGDLDAGGDCIPRS